MYSSNSYSASSHRKDSEQSQGAVAQRASIAVNPLTFSQYSSPAQPALVPGENSALNHQQETVGRPLGNRVIVGQQQATAICAFEDGLNNNNNSNYMTNMSEKEQNQQAMLKNKENDVCHQPNTAATVSHLHQPDSSARSSFAPS